MLALPGKARAKALDKRRGITDGESGVTGGGWSLRADMRGRDAVAVPTMLVIAAVVVGCAYGPWVEGDAGSVSGVELTTHALVVVSAGVIAALLGFLYLLTRRPALWLLIAATGVVAEVSAFQERAHLAHLHSLDIAGWALDVDLAAPALLTLAAIYFAVSGLPAHRLGILSRISGLGLFERQQAPADGEPEQPALVPNEALARALAEIASFIQGGKSNGTDPEGAGQNGAVQNGASRYDGVDEQDGAEQEDPA